MLPSIDVRFKNMMKAVEQVIMPALPADEKLAQEQARLMIGHLAMLRDQWKDAVRFEAGSYRGMRALAEALSPHVEEEMAARLRNALDETADTDEADIDALNAAICTIGTAVDAVILEGGGARSLSAEAWNVILDYGEKDALRNRVWFQATGIDPDRDSLPPLAEVI